MNVPWCRKCMYYKPMVKSKDSQRYAKTEDVNVIFTISHFRASQRESKVFSHVCHSVHMGAVGPHCTWSQSLTPTPPRHFQTCSTQSLLYKDSPKTFSNLISIKQVRSASQRLASFWNAFLLLKSRYLRTNAPFLIRDLLKS